jgi:methionyl-tRNA formyltransferase
MPIVNRTDENNEVTPALPVRVLFMGTPDFALPSLSVLIECSAPKFRLAPRGLQIIGVVTRPDKASGRGRHLIVSPVKQYALEHGLAVYQPGSLRRTEAQELLASLAPDLIVVAAFGQILPPEVLRLPRHGCLNVHASLLPRHRGASPISAAILAGDRETGVTIMLMDEGLDTGPILGKSSISIEQTDTAGILFERLGKLGAELLLEVVPRWLTGKITPEPQDPSAATLTHVLSKEDGLMRWSDPAPLLERAVRAYSPWPGAFTTWNGQVVKVQQAHVLELDDSHDEDASTSGTNETDRQPHQPGRCFLLPPPGSPGRDRNQEGESDRVANRGPRLACICGQGVLVLDVIQLAGKRALPAEDVLRGHADLATALLGT